MVFQTVHIYEFLKICSLICPGGQTWNISRWCVSKYRRGIHIYQFLFFASGGGQDNYVFHDLPIKICWIVNVRTRGVARTFILTLFPDSPGCKNHVSGPSRLYRFPNPLPCHWIFFSLFYILIINMCSSKTHVYPKERNMIVVKTRITSMY